MGRGGGQQPFPILGTGKPLAGQGESGPGVESNQCPQQSRQEKRIVFIPGIGRHREESRRILGSPRLPEHENRSSTNCWVGIFQSRTGPLGSASRIKLPQNEESGPSHGGIFVFERTDGLGTGRGISTLRKSTQSSGPPDRIGRTEFLLPSRIVSGSDPVSKGHPQIIEDELEGLHRE